MVYWVIAKEAAAPPERPGTGRTVERLGPYENQAAATQARARAENRYRDRPLARLEIVCDFS